MRNYFHHSKVSISKKTTVPMLTNNKSLEEIQIKSVRSKKSLLSDPKDDAQSKLTIYCNSRQSTAKKITLSQYTKTNKSGEVQTSPVKKESNPCSTPKMIHDELHKPTKSRSKKKQITVPMLTNNRTF